MSAVNLMMYKKIFRYVQLFGPIVNLFSIVVIILKALYGGISSFNEIKI